MGCGIRTGQEIRSSDGSDAEPVELSDKGAYSSGDESPRHLSLQCVLGTEAVMVLFAISSEVGMNRLVHEFICNRLRGAVGAPD